ncbi:MAG: carboxypeptidase-like regulatory domain-containing protein, partial [Candidatus Desantisbacteria bacterium]
FKMRSQDSTFKLKLDDFRLQDVLLLAIPGTAAKGVFVIPPAKISLISPSLGKVGVFVSIAGHGCLPSEPIRIDFGATTTMAIVNADSKGRFAATFIVDSQPTGTLTVKAVGLNCNQAASCTFRVTPSVIEISGQVLAIDGKPIAGANVQVFQQIQQWCKYKGRVCTDSHGRYRVGNLPAEGNYSVVASKIKEGLWNGYKLMWNEYIPYVNNQLPSDENVVVNFMVPRCQQWVQLWKDMSGRRYWWLDSDYGYGDERPNKLKISLSSRSWASTYRFYLSPRNSAKITDYDLHSTGQNGITYYWWYWCAKCARWHSSICRWDFNQKYARIDAANNRLAIDVTLRGLWWQRAFFNQEYIINTGGGLAPGMVLENVALANSTKVQEKRATKPSVSLSFPSIDSDSGNSAFAPALGDSKTSIMIRDVEEDLTTAKMTVKFDPGRVQIKDVESPALPDDGLTILIDKEIDNEAGEVKITALVVEKEQLEGSSTQEGGTSTSTAQTISQRASGFTSAPVMMLDDPHAENGSYTPSTYEEIENIAPIARLVIASSNSAKSPPLSAKEMFSSICISSIELKDSTGDIIEAKIADNNIV